MRDFAESEAARSIAGTANWKVETQKKVVSAMQIEDPALPHAYALLRRLEQSAAFAAMDYVFSRFNSEQPIVKRSPSSPAFQEHQPRSSPETSPGT